MRLAICTGGGDAPGLNAVIRAVVLSAHGRGWKSYGIQRGYEGLLSFNGVVPLSLAEVRGITHLGGTILGTTYRGNPFRYITRNEQGVEVERDRSDDLVAAFQASGFDALLVAGDVSKRIAAVGCPQDGPAQVGDPADLGGTERHDAIEREQSFVPALDPVRLPSSPVG